MHTDIRVTASVPLYDTIVAERKHNNAFKEWADRKELFDALLNGAGMSLINRCFRPWKQQGLSRVEGYRLFKKHYRVYYVARKMMKYVLNDIIFHRKLRGELLTTVFGSVLIQFEEMSKVCFSGEADVSTSTVVSNHMAICNESNSDEGNCGKSETNEGSEEDEDSSESDEDDDAGESESDEDNDDDASGSESDEDEDDDDDVSESESDVPSDKSEHDENSNWNHTEDESYDSDDVYDANMFPGYGRTPLSDSGPTFTYPKKT